MLDAQNLTYEELRSVEKVIESCDPDGLYDETRAARLGVRRPDFRIALACGVIVKTDHGIFHNPERKYAMKSSPWVKPSSMTTKDHQEIFLDNAKRLAEAEQEMLYELVQHAVNWRNETNSICRVLITEAGELGYAKRDLLDLFRKLRPGNQQVELGNFTVPRMMRTWRPAHMQESLVS